MPIKARMGLYTGEAEAVDGEFVGTSPVEISPGPQGRLPVGGGAAPEVLSIARRTLRDAAGEEAIGAGGYQVHTAIDLDVQHVARGPYR